MKRVKSSEELASIPEVTQLELSVDWPPGKVSAFLLEHKDELALIDAGMPGEKGRQEFRDELEKAGHGVEDIDYVLLTHHHTDHIGCTPYVIENSDADLILGEGTTSYLRGAVDEDDAYRYAKLAGLRGGYLDESVKQQTKNTKENRKHVMLDSVTQEIEHLESIDIGDNKCTALYTPGHQEYHYAFEFELGDETALFSGDTLIETFRSVTYQVGFAEGMFDAIDAYYGTFETLASRDVDFVYPGHGDVFEDYDAAIELGVNSLDNLVEDVKEKVVEQGECTAVDVVMARAGGDQEIHHMMFDTVGALGYLEKQGEIDSYDEDGVRYFVAD